MSATNPKFESTCTEQKGYNNYNNHFSYFFEWLVRALFA